MMSFKLLIAFVYKQELFHNLRSIILLILTMLILSVQYKVKNTLKQ